MSKPGNGCGSENRVNLLNKFKFGTNWNLSPADVEAGVSAGFRSLFLTVFTRCRSIPLTQ